MDEFQRRLLRTVLNIDALKEERRIVEVPPNILNEKLPGPVEVVVFLDQEEVWVIIKSVGPDRQFRSRAIVRIMDDSIMLQYPTLVDEFRTSVKIENPRTGTAVELKGSTFSGLDRNVFANRPNLAALRLLPEPGQGIAIVEGEQLTFEVVSGIRRFNLSLVVTFEEILTFIHSQPTPLTFPELDVFPIFSVSTAEGEPIVSIYIGSATETEIVVSSLIIWLDLDSFGFDRFDLEADRGDPGGVFRSSFTEDVVPFTFFPLVSLVWQTLLDHVDPDIRVDTQVDTVSATTRLGFTFTRRQLGFPSLRQRTFAEFQPRTTLRLLRGFWTTATLVELSAEDLLETTEDPTKFMRLLNPIMRKDIGYIVPEELREVLQFIAARGRRVLIREKKNNKAV